VDTTVKGSKAKVTKTKKVGKQVEKETVTDEPVGEDKAFTQPVCNVGVGLKQTINLGNFESFQIQIDLHVPCLHKEINAAYKFAKKWVQDRLEVEVKELADHITVVGAEEDEDPLG